jgi:hypothetical protein
MNFLDYIKQGDALKVTALIETVLKQKTLAHIKEQRSVVSKSTYPDDELTEALTDDQSKKLKDPICNNCTKTAQEHPHAKCKKFVKWDTSMVKFPKRRSK